MPSLYDSIKVYENTSLTALYFENKTITYKKLIANVKKMISYFQAHGIKQGDVVTVVLPNIPATIYSFYALNAMGVIQNIIHPLTSIQNVIESMKNTNSKHAIILATTYQENIELFKNSNLTFFFANPMYDNSFIMKNAFYLKYKKVKETDKLFLLDKFRKFKPCNDTFNKDSSLNSIYLHSGGTTGIPKIIALSDDAINNLASKVCNSIIYEEIKGKSMLAVLPTFHGFGLGMGIHAPLYNGASSALMIKFNSKKVIKWINQNKVNLVIGVPLLYQKLMKDTDFEKAKLSNLQYCFIGGDNVPQSLILSFNSLMEKHGSNAKLLEGYGLTETVTVCSVNTKKDFKLGSVGKPLNDITIKVLNENNQEIINEIGEVYITGNTLMNGYLNDINTTNSTLININGINYVKTGDLGYLDNDGFLFLKGRKKRMFKISGINVYPSEIEKIATDLDDILDASLEFYDMPSPHLILFVIKHKDSTKTKEEISKIIYEILNEKVLKYSIPKDIIFIKKFPQTKVGKIDHEKLKDFKKIGNE